MSDTDVPWGEPFTVERLRAMMAGQPRDDVREHSTVLWAADEIDKLRAIINDLCWWLQCDDGELARVADDANEYPDLHAYETPGGSRFVLRPVVSDEMWARIAEVVW